MKKLLLSVAMLVTATGVHAQMDGNTARIGIKAGVNLSRMHFSGFSTAGELNDRTKDRVGYNFTVYGDFGVAPNFFIQPGISLQNKGTKLEGTAPGGSPAITGVGTVDVMAIEVPVNAVVRIPTGTTGAFQISAGPYVAFNIDGQTKTTVTSGGNTTTDTNDLAFGNSTDDDLSGTEFGANFGLAYRLNSGINFGANYGLGLSNLVPKDNRTGDVKATNRVLGFTIGYSF